MRPEKDALGPILRFDCREAEELIRAALIESLGGDRALWEDGDSELLLEPERARVAILERTILVGIPVYCEQTGSVEMIVPFAFGTHDAPAGLLAATESEPRGSPRIADRWGEALIAAAWNAVLSAARGAAEESGRFVPAVISASTRGLEIELEPA